MRPREGKFVIPPQYPTVRLRANSDGFLRRLFWEGEIPRGADQTSTGARVGEDVEDTGFVEFPVDLAGLVKVGEFALVFPLRGQVKGRGEGC